jgi:hypothetical protein
MFLLKQILFCSPLIIYAGFRIWGLIPQRLFKILFPIVYILLVTALPIAETLSHSSGAGWADFIMVAGYYSLPLLLYLLLVVILLDLVIGFALVTGILAGETAEEIGNAFYLVGRNDGRSGGRKSINELLKKCDKSLPIIVLDHRPTDLDHISLSGADILLSGHTHNGQLFPVNLIVKRYYELSWGYELKKETHVFVTSGIQVWGPPVRTAGDSEILIVNVSFR